MYDRRYDYFDVIHALHREALMRTPSTRIESATIAAYAPTETTPASEDAPIKKGTLEMTEIVNPSLIVVLATNKVKMIGVVYNIDPTKTEDQRVYSFKTIDDTIAVDDLVLVPNARSDNFTVARVVTLDAEVEYEGTEIRYKWIVGKIDLKPYEEVLKREQQAIDYYRAAVRRRQREALADMLLKSNGVAITEVPFTLDAEPDTATE